MFFAYKIDAVLCLTNVGLDLESFQYLNHTMPPCIYNNGVTINTFECLINHHYSKMLYILGILTVTNNSH